MGAGGGGGGGGRASSSGATGATAEPKVSISDASCAAWIARRPRIAAIVITAPATNVSASAPSRACAT